ADGASARYTRILDAGCELFYERGFAAVTVNEIGERAGVHGPNVYRHFRSKDVILATLFEDAIDRLVASTSRTCEDPREELELLVRGHIGFVLADRRLAGVMLREERSLAPADKQRVRRREARYAARWVDCLQRCFPNREPDALRTAALTTVGALNSIASWPRDAATRAQLGEEVVTVTLDGLGSLATRSIKD
ncbi:MAG: TetR/AcrR family transcriptional regulator, partial [Solirubrobacterales bacterium]|nr:TetR/AcrR family transcriptional regulator [Solirubrobacterales bacterium]